MATATSRQTASEPRRFNRGTVSSRPPYLRPVPSLPARDQIAAELDRIGTAVTVARGKTVIEEGAVAEHLFKVAGGALRSVRLLPDGRRYITKFLLPGDYFGVAEGDRYGQTVEVVGEATLICYPRSAFDALLARDAAACRRFYGVVCSELRAAQERLLLLGRKSALERLVTFLLGMADRGQSEAENVLDLPMNRSDVADYLGLTVETVSRLLTHLRSEGILELPSPNHLIFLKREILERISLGEI